MEKTNDELNKLTVEAGDFKTKVFDAVIYRPADSRSNVVFHVEKPIVLYKYDGDADESIPMETTDVKVYTADILEAIRTGKIPFLSYLKTLDGRLSNEVISALANSVITFTVTPYEKGDKYIGSDGEDHEYEHHGARVSIKYAILEMSSVQLAIMAIQLKKKKVM